MSKFSRLFDMASKAISESSSSKRDNGRSTDWRGVVRNAAEALKSESATGPQPGRDRLAPPPASAGYQPPPPGAPRRREAATAQDRAAIARYDYLMQTADPHQVEQIHREAFARLSPTQRAEVEARMRSELPAHERPASSGAPDLARSAARAEAARPGRMRGMLARAGGGAALAGAGVAAGGVLAAVAGGAVVSSVAGPLLEQAAGFGVDFDALAQGVDVEGIAAGAGDIVGSAGEQIGGLGDQVSGLGDGLGGFELSGIGDLFGR